MNTGLKLFLCACLIAGMYGARVPGQDNREGSPAHTFEPSDWTPEDRIKAVENGLLMKPIILTDHPPERTDLFTLMKQRNVPGVSVAVIDGGKIVWAKGYGVTDLRTQEPVTPDTLFSAGGITKFVTA